MYVPNSLCLFCSEVDHHLQRRQRTLILNNTCGRNSFFYLKIVQCLVAMYVLGDQLKQKNEEDNRTIKDYISRRSIY